MAYPLGLKGIVVGQGDTYEEALADVKSAIKIHIVTFLIGEDVLSNMCISLKRGTENEAKGF